MRLANVVGLLVLALGDENALRRTFLFADLAGDAAQASVRVVAVKNEEWEVARGFLLRQPLFGILHGRQPVFRDITADEIPGRLRHAFDDAFA